ncbi:MAG: arachidonate 15-lipoxygenase [Myxococcota bacterium]
MTNESTSPSRPGSKRSYPAAKTSTRDAYHYLPKEDNQLFPICTPKKWPWFKEQYGPSWLFRFLPGFVGAYLNQGIKKLRFLLQRITFRFDKITAYKQLFVGKPPKFVEGADRDDQFAWRRIAGPNPLSLQQEQYLSELSKKIPLDLVRIEKRLSEKMGRPISLHEEAEAGHLFACDYRDMQEALRPQDRPTYLSPKPIKRTRASRWREKYLPAPIAVFLELPGFYEEIDLVPLAIQIDQIQPDGEPDAIHYPDDPEDRGWGWRIAKLYFETADTVFHAGCGHVLRAHFAMNAFCMATPRQLGEKHPIFMLLRPHTRFTMAANKAAYKDYLDRKQIYAELYSLKLEEYRAFSIDAYNALNFMDLALPVDLERRHITSSPENYPYRDDAKLWLDPINTFVGEYIDAFYECDDDVAGDVPLQAWKEELTTPGMGGIVGLVPDDELDTKKKLVDLLTHVLFVAGPGHASQHYAEMRFYRYPLAFVGSAYAPPPLKKHEAHRARFYQTLPPISQATTQFTYSTFGDFQYDRFGDYSRYPLGSLAEARGPIRKLQTSLREVDGIITERMKDRPLDYGFLRPSSVPNSINI